MRIACPRCQEPVAGADVDLANDRALCRACGELFPLPSVGAVLDAIAPRGALTGAMDVAHRPTDLAWSEHVEGRIARMRMAPSRIAALPLLGFAIIWDAFLLFWYSAAFTGGGKTPSIMFWFPLLHVGVGFLVTWGALTRLFNSSRFTFDQDGFTLRNGPIPERGARESLRNVDRFEVLESPGRRSSTWRIRMLTGDGRAVKLSLPIDRADHVAFVAARLNAALQAVREPLGYRG